MARTTHNVTIDPDAAATPVDDPEIAEVVDLVTGDILDAKAFISRQRYGACVDERVRLRQCLKQDKPRHVCALCSTPVYLVASPLKRFHFRHIREDGSCPAKTRSALTEEQIRARKYHGLRESEEHKRIKALIERSLRADPDFTAESIQIERRWNAAKNSKLWRQPDVQAQSYDGRFAFEAQLSTTFLDVVVSRRIFYRAEGAILVWVLRSFSPDYRRMTTDDLLFSNNSNVFVVDDETANLSEERKRFHLRCYFRRPFRNGDTIEGRWEEALVCFSDLVKDLNGQRIFYFDYETEERRIKEESNLSLQDDFFSFWLEVMNTHFDGTIESLARWKTLKSRFLAQGIAVPGHPSGDKSFRTLIHAVLSAKFGKPVGWQFDTLIQVAHLLAEAHPENLLAFGYALKHAGRDVLLKDQDTKGKWARRKRNFMPLIRRREPAYIPNLKWLPALSFLFPEVGKSVRTFLEKEPVLQGS